MRPVYDLHHRRRRTFYVHGNRGVPGRLRRFLGSFGIAVEAVAQGLDSAGDRAVLTEGRDLLGETGVDLLLGYLDAARRRDASPPLPSVFRDLDPMPPVLSKTTRPELVSISREIERRAWNHRRGRLVAGFQDLSRLATSPRTRTGYDRLSQVGVDVTVCGRPDVAITDVPYRVVPDEDGRFERFWFLLYDGGGDDTRKGALVVRERADGCRSVDDGRGAL